MSKQLSHYEFKQMQKTFRPNVIIILENLEHDENIGSAFRLADAFCADKIYIVKNRQFNQRKIEKTARGCLSTIGYEIFENISQAILKAKSQNYTPISLEICDDSVPLDTCNFSKYSGIALIVGNEKYGVSDEALSQSEFCTHIDIYGNNSSINVSCALAIALYKCCQDRIK